MANSFMGQLVHKCVGLVILILAMTFQIPKKREVLAGYHVAVS
jgi:hypothetical protein